MDTTRDTQVGNNGSGGSDEVGGTSANDNGTDGFDSGTTEETGIRDAFDDLAASVDGIVVDENAYEAPKYFPPPSVNKTKKETNKKTTTKKRAPAKSVPIGISPHSCGLFMGGLFAGVSLLLTGNLSLGVTGREQEELGEALADCLDTIPDSVTTKVIGSSAPWIRLTSTLGGSIVYRYQAVLKAKQVQMEQQQYVSEPPINSHVDGYGAVRMPDPGKVNP